jgi:hypothetical protein
MVRGMEALGASAYATASYVFVVDIFPDNIGSVLVSIRNHVTLKFFLVWCVCMYMYMHVHAYLCHQIVTELCGRLMSEYFKKS